MLCLIRGIKPIIRDKFVTLETCCPEQNQAAPIAKQSSKGQSIIESIVHVHSRILSLAEEINIYKLTYF